MVYTPTCRFLCCLPPPASNRCNSPSQDSLPVCSSPTGTFALRLAPVIMQNWTQIMGITTGALLTLLLITYVSARP